MTVTVATGEYIKVYRDRYGNAVSEEKGKISE